MLNKKVILNSLRKVSSIAVVGLVGLALVGASANNASAKRTRRHTGTYRVYRHHKKYTFGYYKHGRLHFYRKGYFIGKKWHKYAKHYGYGYKGYKHVIRSSSYRYNSASNWWYRKNKKHSHKNNIYPVKSFKNYNHKKANHKNNIYPVSSFGNNTKKQARKENKDNGNIYPVNSFNTPKKQNNSNNNVYPVNSFSNNSSNNINNSATSSDNNSNNVNNYKPSNNNIDHSTYSQWSVEHRPMWEVTKNDNSDLGEHWVAGYHIVEHWDLTGLDNEGHLSSNTDDEYNLYKLNKDIMPSSMNQEANNTYNKYENAKGTHTEAKDIADNPNNLFN